MTLLRHVKGITNGACVRVGRADHRLSFKSQFTSFRQPEREFRYSGLAVPSCGMELLAITGITLRRAVLGILLAAHAPMTPQEVIAELHGHGVTTLPHLKKDPHRVIADLLAHQARIGTVRRVRRGVYVVIRNSMSHSTRWRCLHWRDRLPLSERGEL